MKEFTETLVDANMLLQQMLFNLSERSNFGKKGVPPWLAEVMGCVRSTVRHSPTYGPFPI